MIRIPILLLVGLLGCFDGFQILDQLIRHRERALAGAAFRIFYVGRFRSGDNQHSTDCDLLVLKVHRIPLQAQRLASPKAVGDDQHQRDLDRFSDNDFLQLGDLIHGVEGADLLFLPRRRPGVLGDICADKLILAGIFQRTVDIGVMLLDRVRRERLQLEAVILLQMIRPQIPQLDPAFLEVRDNVCVHDHFIVSVGRLSNPQLGCFQPHFQHFIEFHAAVKGDVLVFKLLDDLPHTLCCSALVAFLGIPGRDPALFSFSVRSCKIDHCIVKSLFYLQRACDVIRHI